MAPKLSHHIFGAFFFIFLVLQPFGVKSKKPAQSLQNLEGAEKGNTFNGLYRVKQYLKAFGYYPNHISVLEHHDHFDDTLESALKAYQQNFHLKVTGKIDSDTIKAIMTPRCGVPDVIPNRTSDGHIHPHRVFNLQVANYTFIGPKWRKYELTYSFLPGVEAVISEDELRPIIADAFQKWADVSPFTFEEAAKDDQGDLTIAFYKYDHGDGSPFDGPGHVVAHAFPPENGRFHYDADENWSSNPSAYDEVDLESIAVHEIGHLLGLGHSQDEAAIMYPVAPTGTTKRELTEDDTDGLQALYGY